MHEISPLPACTDVLVVGAGPAGLTTAFLLRRYGVTDLLLIDKRAVRVQTGHASGIQPRTQEILQTLGLHQDFNVGAGGVAETAFWMSTAEDPLLRRSSVAPEITHETPFRRIITQSQGRTELVLNSQLEQRGVRVSRPVEFIDYEYTDDKDYPVIGFVKDIARGTVETVKCRYLIGCDGANSQVRRAADISSSVQQAQDTWIVTDTRLETDFPDFRRRCAIRTPQGNLMLIPSPHNTVRIYMLVTRKEDLDALNSSVFEGSKHDVHAKTSRTSLLDIIKMRISSILTPYTMTIRDVEWISRYIVGQKVTDDFTDHKNLLFVGDSCHSHSPKAAQGMNTGIQDAYNLSWKLALVLQNRAAPSLLETYNTERKHIAQQLIEFDSKFASLFGDQSSVNSSAFHDLWRSSQGFTSGLDHEYPPGPLVIPSETARSVSTEAAYPLMPGKRLLPMSLIRHIDGWSVSSLETMPSKGEFYEIIFAGDISHEPRRSAFRNLYRYWVSPSSALSVYNGSLPPGLHGWDFEDIYTKSDRSSHEHYHKVLNLIVVHTANHLEIELRPDFELWKYNFYEDTNGFEHRRHGVDPVDGPMQVAIVRPDGMIGSVYEGGEDLGTQVNKYFASFMKRPS